MGQFSAQQLKTIQDMLDSRNTVAPNVLVQRIVAYALDQKIARYVGGIRASQFLVHNENRSTLMLDWCKVHVNGAKISQAGARKAKLNKDSVAFELGPDSDVHISANHKLVLQSNGHIAPVHGSESYASVAGGHFSQFCKAAVAHCKTPIKELQDANGNLSMQVLCHQDEFMQDLIENGWDWLIFPAAAEKAWPQLADFLQFAYNAGISIPKRYRELKLERSTLWEWGGLK